MSNRLKTTTKIQASTRQKIDLLAAAYDGNLIKLIATQFLDIKSILNTSMTCRKMFHIVGGKNNPNSFIYDMYSKKTFAKMIDKSYKAFAKELLGRAFDQFTITTIKKTLSSIPKRDNETLSLSTLDILTSDFMRFITNIYPNLKTLEIWNLTSLNSVRFPEGIETIRIYNSTIKSLKGIEFPNSLTEFTLYNSQINSLQDVRFPKGLKKLELTGNKKLKILQERYFPQGIEKITLSVNIIILKGVTPSQHAKILYQ